VASGDLSLQVSGRGVAPRGTCGKLAYCTLARRSWRGGARGSLLPRQAGVEALRSSSLRKICVRRCCRRL